MKKIPTKKKEKDKRTFRFTILLKKAEGSPEEVVAERKVIFTRKGRSWDSPMFAVCVNQMCEEMMEKHVRVQVTEIK